MVALLDWLRQTCVSYAVEPLAVFRLGTAPPWPKTINDEPALIGELERGGYFLPLPTEPAALANVIEVSLVDFLCARLEALPNASATRGTERGYPDIEVFGEAFGGGHHAVDIKVARRAKNGRATQSRISLYTGNTFFMYPTIRFPGTFRKFSEYASHVDILAIYTLNRTSNARIDDFEVIIQEPWRIASKQRSSTTREYLGAVKSLDDLRNGRGEFQSEEEFYKFWRDHPFKIGKAISNKLKSAALESSGASAPAKKVRKGLAKK